MCEVGGEGEKWRKEERMSDSGRGGIEVEMDQERDRG